MWTKNKKIHLVVDEMVSKSLVKGYVSVLPRTFLRLSAIASYTNSKPSQSNSYTMVLPQSNGKPNMQVNQKSTV